MLSERVTTLFSLLQCTSADVARCAGCSRPNIARVKNGERVPRANSRTIRHLAEGAYWYAEAEHLLPALRELCGVSDDGEVVPALIKWLYAEDEIRLPEVSTPRSKRLRAQHKKRFADHFDLAMTLLGVPNARVAAQLGVDVSLISRYRSGEASPRDNRLLADELSEFLFRCAEASGKKDKLAALCACPAASFTMDVLAVWLFGSVEEVPADLARALLRSMDAFTPGSTDGGALPPVALPEPMGCYWGTAGLRNAVIRFLSDAAREGGELLLYSDEPMDWMVGDKDFFALWARLMLECVKRGVHIKIIHNLDRSGKEMVAAISGWFPLYISGMIEPYVFGKSKSGRFCHTVFLHKGHACVHGFFPSGAGDDRWYDYFTDEAHLDSLEREYGAMLQNTAPFLRTYTTAHSARYERFCAARPEPQARLLAELPAVTMPQELLERMLSRARLDGDRRAEILSLYSEKRNKFQDALRRGTVDLILCPANPQAERRQVNFSADFVTLPLFYTEDEYAEHLAAVRELVRNEESFRLTLLPFAPFRGLQIALLQDAVTVLRCLEPYAAFTFMNPQLRQSVFDYFDALIDQYAADRDATAAALERRL